MTAGLKRVLQQKSYQGSEMNICSLLFCCKLRKFLHVDNFCLFIYLFHYFFVYLFLFFFFSRELHNNQIPSIPVGWLDSFKNLREL